VTPIATRSNQSLHILIDQALSRIDHHSTLAFEHSKLSQFHERQAQNHRAILASLEKLIPSRPEAIK